jgi:hypothetical protein
MNSQRMGSGFQIKHFNHVIENFDVQQQDFPGSIPGNDDRLTSNFN